MYRTHAYRDVLECFSASEFATCLHARTFYANILWDAPFLTNSGTHEGGPLRTSGGSQPKPVLATGIFGGGASQHIGVYTKMQNGSERSPSMPTGDRLSECDV